MHYYGEKGETEMVFQTSVNATAHDSSVFYEVEFCSGGYEYTYEISSSGSVLRFEKEPGD